MSAGSTTVAPSRLQVGDGRLGDRVGLGAGPEHALAPDADPGAAQAVGVEEAAVVAVAVALGVGGGRVAGVDPGHGPEHGGGVGHGAGHGAGHVLAVGDRDHARAAGQPRVGLIPTRALCEEGQTIDPSVSVPSETAARLAAAAVPDPELEPHGLWSST